MEKNKLIRAPADKEVVSSFARQYQVIKAKKKQLQPTSRQASTEESEKTKENGEEAQVGELMKSKVNKKAAEEKKATEEAVQKRLDAMKNNAAIVNGGGIDTNSKESKDARESNDSLVTEDSKEAKPVEITEPKSATEVVAPKKKKKKVIKDKGVAEKAKAEAIEAPKVDEESNPKTGVLPTTVSDPPKENTVTVATSSIVDKVISEMAAGESQPKNRLAVVEIDPHKGEIDEGKREWSPTPAPRTRRQRSPLTPLTRKAAKVNGERPPIPDGPSPPPPKDEEGENPVFFSKDINNGTSKAINNGAVEVRNGGEDFKRPLVSVRFAT